MSIIGGWHMPESDKYFAKFIPQDGPLPKQNGFQRENLIEAFRHVRKWDVALDIGAFVGFWTRDMAERFKRVFAFEASAETYNCLRKNTDDLPNVRTFNKGVGSSIGSCRVRIDAKREAGGNTASRFIVPNRGGVPMVTVDSLNLSACDFVKIDVEGFELRVLEGAAQTLERLKPTIIMECKDFAGRYDIPFGTAETYLKEQGYRVVAHMRPDKVFVPA